MRGYENIVFGTFMIIIGAIITYIFVQNVQIDNNSISNSVVKGLSNQIELIDYGMYNNSLYVYLRPLDKVNISSIIILINKEKPIIREIGNGDGIVDPSRGEVIEIVYNKTENLGGTADIFVYGTSLISRTMQIDISNLINVTNIPLAQYCTWYLPDWKCRSPVYITSFSSPMKNFQLNISLDTQTLISQGKLRNQCEDLRFTGIYPYEGTNYTDGLILNLHFDSDVKDYSGLNNNGDLTSGSFVNFIFNHGLENGSVVLPSLNLSQFTITLWLKSYNNSIRLGGDWWNISWKYRVPINVSNENTFDIFKYPIKIVIDTLSLYSQGKVKSDLSDIRVIQKMPVYKFEIFNPNPYDLTDYQMKLSVVKYSGKQMYFNGSSYIEVQDSLSLDITDQITICAWINTTGSTDQMIVGKNNAYLFAVVSSGNLYFNYYDGANWVGAAYSNRSVNDGKPYFVCSTYNSTSGKVRFYIDGYLDNEVIVTNSSIATSTYNLRIGDMAFWNWYFNGSIDEVRIYNRVLLPSEILDCFKGSCPDSGLVLYHSYDDGTAIDLSGNGNDGVINGVVSISPGIKGLLWNGNFSVYDTSRNVYLSYCFEQLGGECNKNFSKYIYIKINLTSNSNIILHIFPEENNNATDGMYIFDFYDDFEIWTGWIQYNGGVVSQDCITFGFCTLKKDVNPDPSGGYKDIGYTIDYPFVLEARIIRPSVAIYNGDRVGIIDNNGNGYGISIADKSGNDDLSWDKRTNYNLASSTALVTGFGDVTGNWYRVRIIWNNNGTMIFKVFDDNWNLLASGTATDTSYNQFTRVYVFGGYPYYVDWIRVRKYTNLEPQILNVSLDYIQLEIPFVFETSSGFNNTDTPSSNTWVWFKARYLPATQNTTFYIYYGNPNALPKGYSSENIFGDNFMEIGKITLPSQSYAGEWFSFSFSNTFTDRPVLIAQPDVTYNGIQPFTIWIRGLNTTGFQARQKEPSNLDDIHASEDVFYIAAPEGSWVTTGGIRIEVGRFNTTNWDIGDGSSPAGAFTNVSYRYPFDNLPAVMTQIQEIDNNLTGGWEAHTRIQNIGTSSFETAPEPQGNITVQPNINIEIGWIAIENHTDKDISKYMKSESGLTDVIYDSTWRTLSFYDTYSNPGFMGWIATNYGGDSSRLRGSALQSNSISLLVQEDTSFDTETTHIQEAISYFVFEYPNTSIKIYLIKYIPNITLYRDIEESLVIDRKKIISKVGSFGLESIEDNIYGFVNTTNGYKEVSTKIDLNQIYFITLRYDGNRLDLFLNDSVANYTFTSGSIIQNNNNLTIDFKGIIDELRIYNISLNDSAILNEYNRNIEKELSYYVENCNSQNTTVFIKIPALVNQTIYMYYCNPNANSTSNPYSVFDFYDDFEIWTGWTQYGAGRVIQDCTTFGFCTLKKDTSSWPDGGYKDLGFIINYPFIYEERFYRYDFAGGPYETLAGITDSSGYGYWAHSSSIDGSNSLRIERVDSYPTTTQLSSTAGNYNAYVWNCARFIWNKGNIKAEIWSDCFNNLLSYTNAIDNTYNSFSRIWVTNGYTYFIDWIRIRKYTEPWPIYSIGTEETC